MRFLHLTETSGTFTGDCFNCGDAQVVSSIPLVTDCIPVNDCISNTSYLRNVIYTNNGWYLYTGNAGLNEHPANQWLHIIDFTKCQFEIVP